MMSNKLLSSRALLQNGTGSAATLAQRADPSTGPHLVPSERVLKLWRSAQAVCFDIDCERKS